MFIHNFVTDVVCKYFVELIDSSLKKARWPAHASKIKHSISTSAFVCMKHAKQNTVFALHFPYGHSFLELRLIQNKELSLKLCHKL